jgi:excisionase family DNA binding protein
VASEFDGKRGDALPTASAPDLKRHSSARLPAAENPSQKFLTILEVCARLNLSRTTIWRIMNQHGLRFVRIGGSRRIRECDLETWLEQHTVSLSSEATRAKR